MADRSKHALVLPHGPMVKTPASRDCSKGSKPV